MKEIKTTKLEKQHSLESNTGSSHSVVYSSDDSSNNKNESKKSGRRQFLPSGELEKLRQKERVAKQKQRERYRQENCDSDVRKPIFKAPRLIFSYSNHDFDKLPSHFE